MAESGSRGPTPTDKTDAVVQALENYERPFMGTGELADELGYSTNPGVTNHLERAEEKGEIEKTTVSGYNVWYLPDLVQASDIDTTTGRAPGAGGGRPPIQEEDEKEDTTANFSGEMAVPGMMILALVFGVVGYIGLRLVSMLHQTLQERSITDGLTVDLKALGIAVAYSAGVITLVVTFATVGIAFGAWLWSLNPLLAVAVGVAYAVRKALQWPDAQASYNPGVPA